MSEPIQPEWLKGFAPTPTTSASPRKGNPAWTPGCKSPNPKGRPPGIVDKRQKVAQALADDAPAIARVVIDAALEGDMQAASLVLARIAPSLKAQSEKVEFAFDASAPVTTQIEQVLAGIASGAVAPDIGKQIIEAIGQLANARAAADLEARIAALEDARHA